MKKIKIFYLLIAVSVLFLNGCKDKNVTEEVMPDDTPWNNGEHAIMETENGYYTNHDVLLFLRYHDKKTGKEIMLCDKPECKHDGNEGCTATYKNLISGRNTILYNGNIYFTGLDNSSGNLEAGLYRASLDGSSLDRVGKYFEAKNITDEFYYDQTEFIIHRGYAYIYYEIYTNTGGQSYGGFIGSGFVRMNIMTGDVEKINSCNDFFSITSISHMQGRGDYIYFSLSDKGSANKSGWYKYNINDGKMSLIIESKNRMDIKAVTDDKIYVIQYDQEYKSCEMFALDSSTLEKLYDAISLKGYNDILAYDGKVFVCTENKVTVYKDNKTVGSIVLSDELEDEAGITYTSNFKISDQKLYYSKDVFMNPEVYFCPIDDILSGNAQWNLAYSLEEEENQWGEHFMAVHK